MTQPRVLALTPNPALDITITIDEMLQDATIRIDAAAKRLGGKGINVASVAAQQGYTAVALGPVAEADRPDRPTEFRQAFTATPARLRHTYAIHEVETNNTTIINERGQSHPKETFEQLFADIRAEVEQADGGVLTVSGSLPPGCPEDFFTRIIAVAHQADVRVIADTSGAHLLEACKAGADLVKPNIDEIREATGIQDSVEAAELLRTLGARTVVVSMGKDGLLWVGNAERVGAKLSRQLSGNPTGAGDALVAALACSLVDAATTEDTLRRGVAWSAAAVLEPEAGRINQAWTELADEVLISKHT